MKYIIDLPEDTASDIAILGTFLTPRDKERLQIAFRERQLLDGVLQEIQQEISESKYNHRGEYNRELAFNICLQIIDKHLKEIEE